MMEKKTNHVQEIVSFFLDLCEREFNKRPQISGKEYAMVKHALKNHSVEEIKELLEYQWLPLGKSEEETLELARALSTNQLDNYRIWKRDH